MTKKISAKELKILNKYHFPWENTQFSQKAETFGAR